MYETVTKELMENLHVSQIGKHVKEISARERDLTDHIILKLKFEMKGWGNVQTIKLPPLNDGQYLAT